MFEPEEWKPASENPEYFFYRSILISDACEK